MVPITVTAYKYDNISKDHTFCPLALRIFFFLHLNTPAYNKGGKTFHILQQQHGGIIYSLLPSSNLNTNNQRPIAIVLQQRTLLVRGGIRYSRIIR